MTTDIGAFLIGVSQWNVPFSSQARRWTSMPIPRKSPLFSNIFSTIRWLDVKSGTNEVYVRILSTYKFLMEANPTKSYFTESRAFFSCLELTAGISGRESAWWVHKAGPNGGLRASGTGRKAPIKGQSGSFSRETGSWRGKILFEMDFHRSAWNFPIFRTIAAGAHLIISIVSSFVPLTFSGWDGRFLSSTTTWYASSTCCFEEWWESRNESGADHMEGRRASEVRCFGVVPDGWFLIIEERLFFCRSGFLFLESLWISGFGNKKVSSTLHYFSKLAVILCR